MDTGSSKYFQNYLQTLPEGERAQSFTIDSGYFCADKVSANTCSDLIQRGIKTATCSMKHWYESGKERYPQTGDLFIVTTWDNEPTSIVEITSVTECRFCDVEADFAKAEGEGDQSLEWWKKTHWKFFEKECNELDIEPAEDMILVLERFKLVYTSSQYL